MANKIKDQKQILEKLNIPALNAMQEEAQLAIANAQDVVVLSPTGTGKTLAFLLPIIELLDETCEEVQVLIVAPSRELAMQIETVTREMGTGYKTNVVYGGRPFSKDKVDLQHRPAILVGTPGRIADHLRKETFTAKNIKILVLDEFDKSLEIGFEEEMKEILEYLPGLKKRILTSATHYGQIPRFVGMKKPETIDYLSEKISQLEIRLVVSPEKDKLHTLVDLLCHLGNQPGIIFCNFKETIDYVSDHLTEKGIGHGCFYGGMEQIDRERTLIKFRNGTHQLLIATDLAARGLDIPELKFIIHYQLPFRAGEFTHRNGRTARMNAEGTAYVIQWQDESLPEFIKNPKREKLVNKETPKPSKWQTLYISGGRKDKISKGDIAGLFFKQGKLQKDELGTIELKLDCAFVAVPVAQAQKLISTLNNSKIKQRKVRISLLE